MERVLYWLKKCVFLFIIILLILLTSGCQPQTAIEIGVVGTMSGNQSDLSVSGRRGVELAVKEINSTGGINGRMIQLVVKDDKNNPTRSQEIVKEFVNEKIEVVIGNYTSGMLTAAYDTIQNSPILYVGPTISADSLTSLDDHFIRFIPSTINQANTIIADITKEGYKNFIVVMDEKNKGFSGALRKNFEDQLNAIDGTVKYSIDYSEITGTILKELTEQLRSSERIDSIFVIGNANDIALIAQHLNKEKIAVQIYGPLWSHTNDLITKGGISVEGIRVVSGIDMRSEKESFIKFKQTFKTLYGDDVTFAAMYSYESMMAIAQAMRETKKTDWESIKSKLIELRSFTGLQSDFVLDTFGDNVRQYTLDKIIDGMYKRVE